SAPQQASPTPIHAVGAHRRGATGPGAIAPLRCAPTSSRSFQMSKRYKVAVVGATGAVGETMLAILAERNFPVGELVALASERSAGGKVEFGDEDLVVQDLATFDPSGVDIALF